MYNLNSVSKNSKSFVIFLLSNTSLLILIYHSIINLFILFLKFFIKKEVSTTSNLKKCLYNFLYASALLLLYELFINRYVEEFIT